MEHEETGHANHDDAPLLRSDEERRENRRLEGQLGALGADIARARRDLVRATTAHFGEFLGGPALPPQPDAPVGGERVELRDDSTVVVRPLEPADASLIEGGFEQLSAVNRYQQFLFDRPDLNQLTTVDSDHYALGAIDPVSGSGVGLARYVRDGTDPARAVVGVVIVDAWQGRGLATRLLQRLAAHAREAAIEHFEAHMIVGDTSSERMFESLGPVETNERAAGVVDVTVRIAA